MFTRSGNREGVRRKRERERGGSYPSPLLLCITSQSRTALATVPRYKKVEAQQFRLLECRYAFRCSHARASATMEEAFVSAAMSSWIWVDIVLLVLLHLHCKHCTTCTPVPGVSWNVHAVRYVLVFQSCCPPSAYPSSHCSSV